MLKTITAYVAGLVTALSFVAGAATVTITTTAGQDTRLLAAFRDYFGMPEATAGQVQAEYKAWIIRMTRDVVFTYEQREAQKALTPSATFDPS